jgi:hypothetical protein
VQVKHVAFLPEFHDYGLQAWTHCVPDLLVVFMSTGKVDYSAFD